MKVKLLTIVMKLLMNFLNLGIKFNCTKMQKLLLKDSLEKQRLLLFQMEMQTLSLLV